MADRIWLVMRHQQRGYHWLARRTGYSYSHVKAVAAGIQRASPEFRAKCADALDLPEDLLFQCGDHAGAPEGLAAATN